MKKTFCTVSAIAVAGLLSTTTAQASPVKHEAEGAASFIGGAVIGGLAGGPVGMVIGALGGGLFNEQSTKTEEAEMALVETRSELADLEYRVASREARISELKQALDARLDFQVLFETGDDQISSADKERVRALADYLNDNPGLSVELVGHTDPRGTDEYNNILSRERAITVKKHLSEAGVEEPRIQVSYKGASESQSNPGDLDAYAFERRVDIQIAPKGEPAFTQADW